MTKRHAKRTKIMSPRVGGIAVGRRQACKHQVYAQEAVAKRMAKELLRHRKGLLSATVKRCEICGMIYIEELLG
jgi:hypothetical protein